MKASTSLRKTWTAAASQKDSAIRFAAIRVDDDKFDLIFLSAWSGSLALIVCTTAGSVRQFITESGRLITSHEHSPAWEATSAGLSATDFAEFPNDFQLS